MTVTFVLVYFECRLCEISGLGLQGVAAHNEDTKTWTWSLTYPDINGPSLSLLLCAVIECMNPGKKGPVTLLHQLRYVEFVFTHLLSLLPVLDYDYFVWLFHYNPTLLFHIELV